MSAPYSTGEMPLKNSYQVFTYLQVLEAAQLRTQRMCPADNIMQSIYRMYMIHRGSTYTYGVVYTRYEFTEFTFVCGSSRAN